MSFVLKSYKYVAEERTAYFCYENSGIEFTETIEFSKVSEGYNNEALDRALFMAFVLIGTSYFKTFPLNQVDLSDFDIDEEQAGFFNSVYQEGLSQFAYENKLERSDLGHFKGLAEDQKKPVSLTPLDETPLVLQSGGKDSLLLAQLLKNKNLNFTPWYMSNNNSHPELLDTLGYPLVSVIRKIDKNNLKVASQKGGLDGHVPITYIVLSIALIQAILVGKDTVLAAIGHEGEEPYSYIDDLPVAHQWSKTWLAEQAFANYVNDYVSNDIKVGSPLRKFSELKIAEMFVGTAWSRYSRDFTSCNVANYGQGKDNSVLGWCGNCPKCANSFLLFAPFVEPKELSSVFNGENLFKKDSLTETFKGLLGIDGVEKPFECIGEEAELRKAYNLAHDRSSEYSLPFDVPDSEYDYNAEFDSQPWSADYI